LDVFSITKLTAVLLSPYKANQKALPFLFLYNILGNMFTWLQK